jgi:large repetitive protein
MSSGISRTGIQYFQSAPQPTERKTYRRVHPVQTQLHEQYRSPKRPTTDISQILVVIDSRIDNHKHLAKGVLDGAKVLVLKPKLDGVQQITTALAKHSKITSLHILSPATPGCLHLGSSQLDLHSIERYAWDLQGWFPYALNPSPYSILLYGGTVAADLAGYHLMQQLHQFTGAAIAASAQPTGCTEQGWQLELRMGEVHSPLPFREGILASYCAVK